jgi:LCP family protein required for cell wall assembly
MPDRPRNGGPEDGPEYQWLYGGGQDRPSSPPPTRPVRRQPASPQPDETQVMRTQPKPAAGAPPRRDDRPAQRPPAPPPAPPASRGGGRRWRPRFRFRYLLVLILLWVVFLVGTPIYAWNSLDDVAFEPSGARPAEQPGTTYLMVGSDSRKGLSKQERKELNTGNAAGSRTDSIMLLHTGSGPNTLVSIPRDLEVAIPGHGTSKINAAYAWGGAKLLTQTVEDLTGIRIDQFAEIGMGGVVGVVDAVGGIEICPSRKMDDKDAGLHVKKGCQQADGKTALAYSRSRHAQTLGDLDRVKHQREVIAAIGKKVLSPWTVINPVRYWRLNNAMPDFFTFGTGMGPVKAGQWASAMARVGSHGLLCTVPLTNLSATTLDEDKAKQLFDYIAQDKTDDITDQLCIASGVAGTTGS